MKNLAGHPDATAIFGFVTIGAFTLRIVRRWTYAVATIDPPLPVEVACELAELPTDADGTKYSTCGKLGGVARANGYAGGQFGDDLRRFSPEGVEQWHCDSTAALGRLVAELRAAVLAHGLTADAARAIHRRETTKRWLSECCAHLGEEGHLAKVVRADLHTNPSLDGADPRIAELRRIYPRAP